MTTILPIFPLPDTVFFPGTTLMLQIFEPRYKDMVRDAVAGSGMIVVSLRAGKGFQELGTVGRIQEWTPLENGNFRLRLEGIERMSLSEVVVTTSYRQVQVEARPERTGTNDESSLPVDASLQQELLREDTLIGRQRLGLELFSTTIEMLSWLRAMKSTGSSLVN